MSKEQLTKEEQEAGEIEEPGTDEEAAKLSPEEQLAQAQAEAKEYLNGWQRARAELSNFKKRVERERGDMYEAARGDIVAHFLDVLDDLERALISAPQELRDDGWFEGLALVQRKFVGVLETEGVTEIEAEGMTFDPALHEAISQETSDDHEEGQIIEVVQKGYRLGDRVVRPARVRVAG